MGRTQSRILTAVAFNNAWCVGSQALPSARRVKRVGFDFALNINNYILSPEGRANDEANGFPVGSRSHISTHLLHVPFHPRPWDSWETRIAAHAVSSFWLPNVWLPQLFSKMTSKYNVTDGHHTGFDKEYAYLCDGFTKSWQFRHHGSRINSVIGLKDFTVFVAFD